MDRGEEEKKKRKEERLVSCPATFFNVKQSTSFMNEPDDEQARTEHVSDNVCMAVPEQDGGQIADSRKKIQTRVSNCVCKAETGAQN